MTARIAAQLAATAMGLLMVAVSSIHVHGAMLAIPALAAGAVAAGIVFRSLATLSVVIVAVVIGITGPPAAYAALAGLCAVAYLVMRHGVNTAGVLTVPTAVAAVGFTVAGLVASAFPLRLPWLPLVAPLAVLALCLMAVQPFLHEDHRAQ
jgi:hypothetical protein